MSQLILIVSRLISWADPSSWVQLLFADENLIIVGTTFGLIVFLIVASLIVGLIYLGRRKLKAIDSKPISLSATATTTTTTTTTTATTSAIGNHHHYHHPLHRHRYDHQSNHNSQQSVNNTSNHHDNSDYSNYSHHNQQSTNHLYHSLTRNHNQHLNSSTLYHYAGQKYSINQSKTSSLNKLPILDERSTM